MRASFLLFASLCVAFTSVAGFSQVQTSAGVFRSHIQGIDIPAVANAPFTAKVLVTWNQPVVGGGTASRKYYTLVARDSEGRVHREFRQFVPGDSNTEPHLRSFTILDPVAGTRTVCTTASMSCTTGVFHPHATPTQDAATISQNTATHTLSQSNGNVTRESLGQQTISQLPVVGTRETVTNVSGTHGTSRTRTDSWYSPDLHMHLSVTRKSPQLGKVALKVTDLVQGEPDASWFAVPSGYTVKGTPSQTQNQNQ